MVSDGSMLALELITINLANQMEKIKICPRIETFPAYNLAVCAGAFSAGMRGLLSLYLSLHSLLCISDSEEITHGRILSQ
jgi:hypothetical protein